MLQSPLQRDPFSAVEMTNVQDVSRKHIENQTMANNSL